MKANYERKLLAVLAALFLLLASFNLSLYFKHSVRLSVVSPEAARDI